MSLRTYRATLAVDVEFTVPDEAIIRAVENHDGLGVPQPDFEGGTGWRNVFYDLRTERDVVAMLAGNLGLKGASLSDLDGWADIRDTTSRHLGRIVSMDLDTYERVEPEAKS